MSVLVFVLAFLPFMSYTALPLCFNPSDFAIPVPYTQDKSVYPLLRRKRFIYGRSSAWMPVCFRATPNVLSFQQND
ncbi:hypothetical protein BJ165DRAFT_203481 [Panaeolus papilionaceus]|nr:hypothetical protein BJ165DRAFT_203481 [Panaeolus papilionaceus]